MHIKLQSFKFYKIAPLIILIILNIIIRAPIGIHYVGEGNSDIAMFCLMAESMLSNGWPNWLLHPASIFGLADYSYPSLVPFFLAAMMKITGLTRLDLLIPISLILGAICVVVAYKMGYAYSMDPIIAFFTAFAFSLSPIAIEDARVFSFSRSLFFIISALIFYFIFKYKNEGGILNISFILLLTILNLMTHRMALVLLILLIVSYSTLNAYQFSTSRSISLRKIVAHENKIFCMIGILEFLFIFSPFYPFKSNLMLLQHGFLFNGTSMIIMILNMIIDYMAGLNPILVLGGALGLILVLTNKEKTFLDRFLLFFILLCIPLLGNSEYSVHIMLIIVSLFFAVLLKYVLDRVNSKLVFLSTIFVLVLIFSLLLSPPLKNIIFHKDDESYIGMPQTAKYLSGMDGDIYADTNFISRILMLYGHRPVYPFMGPEYPIYYDNFKDRVFDFSISNYFKTNMYYLFKDHNKINITKNIKYIYSREDKKETRVYTNSREHIYAVS